MNYSRLLCPSCKAELTCGDAFQCRKCNIVYSVYNGIPIMLGSKGRGEKDQERDQNVAVEKEFYEDMFGNLKGLEDGHCIVYGYEEIYELMKSVERGTVIEPGCGAGHHGVNLSKMGFKVTSIDLSLNGLAAAKALAEHEKQDISFVCGDIMNLPFADNEFETCFCSLVLHHFNNLDNVIKELTRVTRKQFISFEVNALDPVTFLRFNIMNPVFGIRNIVKNQRALFPNNLIKILKDYQFDIVRLTFEDAHEYLGRYPNSLKAKMIHTYQAIMKMFPGRYSKNKFLLYAKKNEQTP